MNQAIPFAISPLRLIISGCPTSAPLLAEVGVNAPSAVFEGWGRPLFSIP
jgi:hypothetical protein